MAVLSLIGNSCSPWCFRLGVDWCLARGVWMWQCQSRSRGAPRAEEGIDVAGWRGIGFTHPSASLLRSAATILVSRPVAGGVSVSGWRRYVSMIAGVSTTPLCHHVKQVSRVWVPAQFRPGGPAMHMGDHESAGQVDSAFSRLGRRGLYGQMHEHLDELLAGRDQMESLLRVIVDIGSDLDLDTTLRRVIA